MKRKPPPVIKLSREETARIEADVFAAVEPVLDPRFYLLAVDFEKESGYWYLRLYLERHGQPVSLNDCEEVSRALDPVIDELPALAELAFNMEVSSPGLFRALKTAREFDYYQGRAVRVETAGKSQEGKLVDYDKATSALTLQPTGGAEPLAIPLGGQTQVFLNPEVHFPDDSEAVAPQ